MNKKEMMEKIAEMENEINYLKKELNKQEEPKTGRWKPESKEQYFTVDDGGYIIKSKWSDDCVDKNRYSIGNVFKTREQAEFAVEQLKVLAELKEYADDDKEWNGYGHWFIEYYTTEEQEYILTDYFLATKHIPFNVYFTSREQAQKAIDAIGEERLKKYYFCVEE